MLVEGAVVLVLLELVEEDEGCVLVLDCVALLELCEQVWPFGFCL